MISLLLLLLLLIWLISGVIYFKGEKFRVLSNQVNETINDFNELNNYITDFYTKTNSIQVNNYGQQSSKNICDCSLTVYRNATNAPYKYLCKYFNIKCDIESVKHFETLYNNLCFINEAYHIIINKQNNIKNEIKNQTNWFIRLGRMNTILKKLGLTDINIKIDYPTYTFKYTSPGGKSTQQFDYVLNLDLLESFIDYLKDNLKKRESAAYQRALMTNSLREYIKKRDNYTCKICGNSIYNEPNLLLEIDHIIPISKGGKTEENNLQTLCWKCNRHKSNK